MEYSVESIIFATSLLLLLSILASKAAGKLGVPVLLVFLLIGMLAGSEGVGGIYFDDPWLAQLFGVIALTFIIFAGGFDTKWTSVAPVLRPGVILSTVGVFVTALSVGWFTAYLLGLPLLEGFLLGAIVSSTDAAAVFSILRARGIRLQKQLRPLLELESGSNDPMAVVLTVSLIHLLGTPTTSVADLLLSFGRQLALGMVLGYGMGKALVFIINHGKLEYEGLYPVLTIALVLFIYSVTAVLGGSGFLAVYLVGLTMGQEDFIHKRSLMRFHDGLSWLMQISMFLILGLLVFPSRLIPVIGAGLLVSAFLIFVARPLSVFLSLLFTRLAFREKVFVSWVGLRGAVPIILATFPLLADTPQADMMFNLVFFIVLTSVLLQGTSIPFVARQLAVEAPGADRFQRLHALEMTGSIKSDLAELVVPPHSTAVGKQIVELHLPKDTLIVLIKRGKISLVPNGGTILEADDTLVVLAENLAHVRSLVVG